MSAIHTPPDTFDIAFAYESTFGTPPADASAWDTAVESTGFRLRASGVSFETLVEGAVPDPDLRLRQTQVRQVIKGLRSGGEITLTTKWYGSEAETTANTQIAETALSQLFENALGATSRPNRTTVASITSDVDFVLSAATNIAEGQLIAIEDAGNLGRLWPVRIETLASEDVTTHKDLSESVLAGTDIVHPVLTHYVDPTALNRGGSGYNTFSVLVGRGGTYWQARGCKVVLSKINIARGAPPTLDWQILTAGMDPPGDGAPSAPTWTTVEPEGGAGRSVGIDAYCHLVDFGTTATNHVELFSASVTPGIEIRKMEGITGSQHIHGVIGYQGGLVTSTIEIEVPFDTDYQDDWDAKTYKTLTLYVVTDHGEGWVVHAPKCFLSAAPVPSGFAGEAKEAKRMRLTLTCTEDTADAAPTTLQRSPILLGQF